MPFQRPAYGAFLGQGAGGGPSPQDALDAFVADLSKRDDQSTTHGGPATSILKFASGDPITLTDNSGAQATISPGGFSIHRNPQSKSEGFDVTAAELNPLAGTGSINFANGIGLSGSLTPQPTGAPSVEARANYRWGKGQNFLEAWLKGGPDPGAGMKIQLRNPGNAAATRAMAPGLAAASVEAALPTPADNLPASPDPTPRELYDAIVPRSIHSY